MQDTLPLAQTSLHPPSRDNPRLGVLMSALAHVGLITALTLGVQWRNEEPAGVEAELWAATPQIAAPRANPPPEPVKEVTPPPAPVPAPAPAPPPPAAIKAPPPPPDTTQRDAEIALEKAREVKLEKARQDAADQRAREKRLKDDQTAKDAKLKQARLDKEKQDQERLDKLKAEQADKRQQEVAKQALAKQQAEKADKATQAQAQRLKDQRDAQLRRMNEQLGGTGAANSTGSAARDAGPSAGYAGRIKARIKPNIVLTDDISGNPVAEVEVRVAPDGTIIGRRIVKSSGVKAWDDTVLRAIDRTAMLPRDTNGRVEPTMIISFKPFE